MRNSFLLLLSIGITFSVLLPSSVQASEGRNLPPVAVIASPSNNATFLFGDVVALSGSGSQKNGAPTMTYRWRVKPSGGSWTTVCGPSTSCMDKDYTFTDPGGADEIQYTIELQVVTAYGSNTRTVQVTLRRYLNRTYFVKDHLGSVRATVDEEGTLIGYDDYYPFGLVVSGRSSNSSNPNDETKFTGYEQDDEAGLDMYHAAARGYDPITGRFTSVDPLYMERPGLSTYNYVQNNPLNRVDPTGMLDWYLNNDTQEIQWINGSGEQEGYTHLGEDITLTYNSYIDPETWDGPLPGSLVGGDKLTTSINIDATSGADGSLVGVNVSMSVEIGKTFGFVPGQESVPGLSNLQSVSVSGTDFSATLEHHTMVNPVEALGLNALGFDHVNVAQQLSVVNKGGALSISAATDVFPSASLTISGSSGHRTLFNYAQPSFRATHQRIYQIKGSGYPVIGPRTSSYNLYNRYKSGN